ncbi:hypothetical protein NL676_030820, partial [Syzygium grande]
VSRASPSRGPVQNPRPTRVPPPPPPPPPSPRFDVRLMSPSFPLILGLACP